MHIKSTNCNNILLIITVLYALDGVFPFVLFHPFAYFSLLELVMTLNLMIVYFNVILQHSVCVCDALEQKIYTSRYKNSKLYHPHRSQEIVRNKNIEHCTDDDAIKENLFRSTRTTALNWMRLISRIASSRCAHFCQFFSRIFSQAYTSYSFVESDRGTQMISVIVINSTNNNNRLL